LRQKKQNKYRQQIFLATKFLKENGRLPIKKVDGFSLNQIMGTVSWIKSATRGDVPSRLKKIIMGFEKELNNVRRRKNSLVWKNYKLIEKMTKNN
jgi:hypothetical protein